MSHNRTDRDPITHDPITCDVRAQFLPRFVRTAHDRLARARELLAAGDARKLARELHALAGEAGMLDFVEIARLARDGEAAATRWENAGGEAARGESDACLVAVGGELANLPRAVGSETK